MQCGHEDSEDSEGRHAKDGHIVQDGGCVQSGILYTSNQLVRYRQYKLALASNEVGSKGIGKTDMQRITNINTTAERLVMRELRII